MAIFQESDAKAAIRIILRDACIALGRSNLTYLGMPAESANDVKVLRSLLANAICVDRSAETLREAARRIAPFGLATIEQRNREAWQYLRDEYAMEGLLADVTFLDFYGGGLTKDNPFTDEIAGLRSFFVRQARTEDCAFVFAWTFMPHDKGPAKYVEALRKFKLSPEELRLLNTTDGVELRIIALRLLIAKILEELGCSVKLFHHALYKKVMNTMVLIFCKGYDPNCSVKLGDPSKLLGEPYVDYDVRGAVPRICHLKTV